MRWYVPALWIWGLWSVGASAEFLFDLPLGVLGFILGVVAAVAIYVSRADRSSRLGALRTRRGSATPPA